MSNVTLSILVTYTFNLDWLHHMIGKFNNLERKLTDSEKLFNLTKVDQEKAEGEVKVDKDWIKEGCIQFKDVVLRYRENTKVALDKLKFEVKAGQKIGICGRTGAGKSTVSMALSRIVEIENGEILIDGIDV